MKHSLGAKPLLMPNPVLIVGTYDKKGKPNLMNAAWGGICCSEPPCVALGIRSERKTYSNMQETHAFTVNIPSMAQVKEADYVGIYSGKQQDKFSRTGLTAVPSALVNAPYVEEFPMLLECTIRKEIDLGTHVLVIGEIVDVKIDDVVRENDRPIIEQIKPMVFDFESCTYYAVGDKVASAFSIGKEIGG